MNIFELTIHPAAESCPMLPPDEYELLKEDIQNNGMRHPVLIWEDEGESYLVDGRNRLAVCADLMIEPEYELIEGDPRSIVVSENLRHKHLTKGQQAMATAILYPEVKGRGNKNPTELGFSDESLRKARTILKYAGDLAGQVRDGGLSLNDAYTAAQDRKKAATDGDGALKELQENAPDLATQVMEEQLSLSEAQAAFRQREQDARVNRFATYKLIEGIVSYGDMLTRGGEGSIERVIGFTEEMEEKLEMSKSELVSKLKGINLGKVINSIEAKL